MSYGLRAIVGFCYLGSWVATATTTEKGPLGGTPPKNMGVRAVISTNRNLGTLLGPKFHGVIWKLLCIGTIVYALISGEQGHGLALEERRKGIMSRI